jgi:hypothetical protein
MTSTGALARDRMIAKAGTATNATAAIPAGAPRAARAMMMPPRRRPRARPKREERATARRRRRDSRDQEEAEEDGLPSQRCAQVGGWVEGEVSVGDEVGGESVGEGSGGDVGGGNEEAWVAVVCTGCLLLVGGSARGGRPVEYGE